jgi:beta-glucosidase
MGLAVAQAPIQNQWIPLKAKDLAYWDVQRHQWVVEDEKVNLMVGGSSADVKLQQTIGVKP